MNPFFCYLVEKYGVFIPKCVFSHLYIEPPGKKFGSQYCNTAQFGVKFCLLCFQLVKARVSMVRQLNCTPQLKVESTPFPLKNILNVFLAQL